MNVNTAMTVGAIGFAGFALWHITRKPGGAVSAQPAPRQRDTGLTAWYDLQQTQAGELAYSAYWSQPLSDIFKGFRT